MMDTLCLIALNMYYSQAGCTFAFDENTIRAVTGRIPGPRFCQTNPPKILLASESPNEDVRIKCNVAFSDKMPMCIFDCQKATTTIYNIMLLL